MSATRLLLFLVLLAAPACNCGFLGNCPGENTTCVNGACQTCGAIGRHCCNFETCPISGTCNASTVTCDDCGRPGGRCCPGPVCGPGAQCDGDTGMCHAIESSGCNTGSTVFSFGVRWILTHCAVDVVSIHANTKEEAIACIRSALPSDEELVEETDLELRLVAVTSEQFGCNAQTYPALSDEDAIECAESQNCAATMDCEGRIGECP